MKELIVFGYLLKFFVVFANVHEHLSSTTPYRLIANDNVDQFHIPGCTPIKIWMVIRHGTRYPKTDLINQMNERLPELKNLILNSSYIREDSLKEFKEWDSLVKNVEAKMLTEEGENEMLNLGERMQLRFPTLFPEIYSSTTYRFNSTATNRTRASMKHFLIGLFGKLVANQIVDNNPIETTKILRFYETCLCWLKRVKENPERFHELNTFSSSEKMKEALEMIGEKLGFSLSFEDAFLIYESCGFETAWNKNGKKSPWCLIFDKNSIQVLEYIKDLKHFYKDGYGYEITYKQSCVAFKDMLDFFHGNEHEKSVVYFTHSGTLLKILTYLGLYKDLDPLKHHNFDSNRRWRTSKIDAFATNLAFVLFRCGQEEKVMLFHQERPVKFPGCELMCSFLKLKNLYRESVDRCDLEEICSLDNCFRD